VKYDQLPQGQQIDSIVPNHLGAQVPGGAIVQFPSGNGMAVPNYGVDIGLLPHAMPAVANVGVDLAAVPGHAAQINNLLTCACVVYIYTNAGGVQRVVVYHAHTGIIFPNDLPLGVNFGAPGFAAADVHIVFASSQSMDLALPLNGIQTASSGLHALLAAGIPAGNIRVLTGCGITFGANEHGDVGRAATPAFTGNDLPTRVNNALPHMPVPLAATHNHQGLVLTLTLAMMQAHTALRDTLVLNALRGFITAVSHGGYPPGSYALALAVALETQIWGIHAVAVNTGNAQARINAALGAIEVGIRQL
jgi:hypothetical protein